MNNPTLTSEERQKILGEIRQRVEWSRDYHSKKPAILMDLRPIMKDIIKRKQEKAKILTSLEIVGTQLMIHSENAGIEVRKAA